MATILPSVDSYMVTYIFGALIADKGKFTTHSWGYGGIARVIRYDKKIDKLT